MRARRPLLTLLLTWAVLLLAGPGCWSARAADNGTWSVYPTPPKDTSSPTSRAYFFHQGEPGTTIEDRVTLANSSNRPLTFQVYATDAVNTPVGGAFALLPVESEAKDVGRWLSLPKEVTRDTVTVPPRSHKDVPFTLKVPEDASPGDHVGGIVALNTEVEGIEQQGKVKVGVKRSVGARVYVRVPGPVTAAVGVEQVRIRRGAPLLPWTQDARATVSYTLVNRGNAVVSPRVSFRATGVFGHEVLRREARDLPLALLPGQRVSLTELWSDAPQLDRVTLHVTVSAADHPEAGESARARFLAVPWPAVGVLMVLLGVGCGLWVLQRRRAGTVEPAAVEGELAGTG
ncbi:WxL protein peptidoglycan domain-containing protein [Streptomyces sp. NPDC006879]|uniref:WxL protein peptidoglycan domain-containing protein n=1 Tax=Streptomyces sp. NPDC006879 TaxID=3364767 RepID=UPI00369135B9